MYLSHGYGNALFLVKSFKACVLNQHNNACRNIAIIKNKKNHTSLMCNILNILLMVYTEVHYVAVHVAYAT